MKPKPTPQQIALSVIIPAYNAASWLPKTIPKIATAINNADIKDAEIIVVDDGSSDGTGKTAQGIEVDLPIKVISQANSGRFLARKLGAEKAVNDYILFIDTRIYIEPKALEFVVSEIAKNSERKVWTSHVYLDKKANIYAGFWDALTTLAWRKYFANPRDYSYGIKEFDYFPKGTTCFFAPKKVIQEANDWFMANTKDLKTSNDDTLLIRHIAEKNNININPKFSCTYHARTNLSQYIKHVFHRGKVFVDGFLRRDGNRFFWPLLAFLVLSIAIPVCFVFYPAIIVPALQLAALLWIVEFIVAILLGVSAKDSFSLFILSPVFAVFYGLGIWSATAKLILKSQK